MVGRSWNAALLEEGGVKQAVSDIHTNRSPLRFTLLSAVRIALPTVHTEQPTFRPLVMEPEDHLVVIEGELFSGLSLRQI